jgi:hypothetical protein
MTVGCPAGLGGLLPDVDDGALKRLGYLVNGATHVNLLDGVR